MRFLGGALVAGGVLTLCYLAILHGWRARQRRQGGLAAPPKPPTDMDDSEAIDGVYVATTTAYDWLDRIAVHGLGVRSRAAVMVAEDGVAILRTAAPSLFIPASDLVSVRTARGIAGKVAVESAGLVVFTWQHDGRRLDTGFRPRHAADVQRLVVLGSDLAITAHGEEYVEEADTDGWTPAAAPDERRTPADEREVDEHDEYEDDEYDHDDLDLDLEPDLDPKLLRGRRHRHYANGRSNGNGDDR